MRPKPIRSNRNGALISKTWPNYTCKSDWFRLIWTNWITWIGIVVRSSPICLVRSDLVLHALVQFCHVNTTYPSPLKDPSTLLYSGPPDCRHTWTRWCSWLCSTAIVSWLNQSSPRDFAPVCTIALSSHIESTCKMAFLLFCSMAISKNLDADDLCRDFGVISQSCKKWLFGEKHCDFVDEQARGNFW